MSINTVQIFLNYKYMYSWYSVAMMNMYSWVVASHSKENSSAMQCEEVKTIDWSTGFWHNLCKLMNIIWNNYIIYWHKVAQNGSKENLVDQSLVSMMHAQRILHFMIGFLNLCPCDFTENFIIVHLLLHMCDFWMNVFRKLENIMAIHISG